MFIAIKTDDGRIKGKISFYCKVLHVSRQAFNKFLKTKDAPWKYQALADAMIDICCEDEYNDTYGRIRMYQALQLKQPEGVRIPVREPFIVSWKKLVLTINQSVSLPVLPRQTKKLVSPMI